MQTDPRHFDPGQDETPGALRRRAHDRSHASGADDEIRMRRRLPPYRPPQAVCVPERSPKSALNIAQDHQPAFRFRNAPFFFLWNFLINSFPTLMSKARF